MFTNVVRKETNAILGRFTVVITNVADMGAQSCQRALRSYYNLPYIITRDLPSSGVGCTNLN